MNYLNLSFILTVAALCVLQVESYNKQILVKDILGCRPWNLDDVTRTPKQVPFYALQNNDILNKNNETENIFKMKIIVKGIDLNFMMKDADSKVRYLLRIGDAVNGKCSLCPTNPSPITCINNKSIGENDCAPYWSIDPYVEYFLILQTSKFCDLISKYQH